MEPGSSCSGERTGSGRTVGVKSEDWKIEESEMNVVKSGLSWMCPVSGMRCACLVTD